jgi:hypothetical protein
MNLMSSVVVDETCSGLLTVFERNLGNISAGKAPFAAKQSRQMGCQTWRLSLCVLNTKGLKSSTLLLQKKLSKISKIYASFEVQERSRTRKRRTDSIRLCDGADDIMGSRSQLWQETLVGSFGHRMQRNLPETMA